MFYHCLLFIVILIILYNSKVIEGNENETHTSESIQYMTPDEIKEELIRIRDDNYADAASFEAMLKKGMCTDQPNTNDFHSCKIEDAKDNKPILDLRYVNPAPFLLHDGDNYTYKYFCPDNYQKTMRILVSENLKTDPELFKMTLDLKIPNPTNFFKNKFSIGQYPGYTQNNYLDRTRYIKSDEPLPVNPDFFVNGGGTYA